MHKNTIITIAILFAMLLIVICFIAFLWGIIYLSKKYGEKLNAARLAKTIPHTFVLKSSKGSFVMAIINITLFAGAFFMFRFILSKGASVTITVQFILSITIVGIAILYEVLGTVFVVAGFATRKLEIDEEQLNYRNWFGYNVSFLACDIISYHTFWIALIRGTFLRFKDINGKKRFACIYLSDYSGILLSKYLNKQGIFKRTK